MISRRALVDAWPQHRRRVVSALLASLTLGLAPFYPHAHIYKQLRNLVQGTLTEPMDVFDLILHGAPWVFLVVVVVRWVTDATGNRSQASRTASESGPRP